MLKWKILSREFDRNMQVYESLQERIFCLPAACALSAGFVVYLGPYQFPFRRIMLTNNWIKCLNDRGMPLVLDSLNLIKGRVIKWQMESLTYLLANSSIVTIPGDDWKVHFASEQIDNNLFIGGTSQSELLTDKQDETDSKIKQFINDSSKTNEDAANNVNSFIKTVKISEPEHGKVGVQRISSAPNRSEDIYTDEKQMNLDDKIQAASFFEESMLRIDGNVLSQMSRLSEQVDFYS